MQGIKESLKMLIQIIRRHFSKNFIFYVVKCQSDAIILILQIKNAHNSYGKKKFIYFVHERNSIFLRL